MDTNLSFYELLGVKNDATEDEIKQAYKKQMKKWHPDINKDPNAVNISSRINEAKEILLDPIKRYDYDEYLKKKVNETYNRYTQKKNKEEYNSGHYEVGRFAWQLEVIEVLKEPIYAKGQLGIWNF